MLSAAWRLAAPAMGRIAFSKPGLVVLTAAALLIFYEGAPLGPLSRIPIVGSALEIATGGRVDRVRLAATRDARRDYVQRSEKKAVEAELAETIRQLRATAAARELFRREAVSARDAAAQAEEQRETEIAAYEQKLETAGRACRLNGTDIEWLRKP